MLPHTPLSRRIDVMLDLVGKTTSWIWLVLLGVIVVNVSARHLFSSGRVEFEELQWHLYSIGFLLGMSYAYQADSHIRVDVLHERMSLRTQAWIELYGILLFLLPFVVLIIYYSIPFVRSSWQLSEVSQAPGGLPYRWFIKAALPLCITLLLLAVLSRFSRVWSALFGQAEVEPTANRGNIDGY